jgi:hypothetical protein
VRRLLYWTAMVLAATAVVAGAAYSYVGYRATSGPDGAVEGYFAALARGDASAALGFGEVPAGPTGLLTDEVLAEQQQLAPLSEISILDVTEHGDTADVHYGYVLGFATGAQPVSGTMRVVKGGSGWRLARTAVPTTIAMDQAVDRFTFADTTVPDGRTLLFPGAVPVRFDTPFLQVDPSTAAVGFGGPATTDVRVEPTPAARAALTRQLTANLTRCVTAARPDPQCPLPSPRTVPGSLHGRIAPSSFTFRVSSTAAGPITVSGTAICLGRYRTLSYDNVVRTVSGRVPLPADAMAYPVAPLTLHFTDGT